MMEVRIVFWDGRTCTIHLQLQPSSTAEVVIQQARAHPNVRAAAGRDDFEARRVAREEGVPVEYQPTEAVRANTVLLVSKKYQGQDRVELPQQHAAVKVTPAPQTLRQDVMHAGFLVNLCELIDNGISAVTGGPDAQVRVEVITDKKLGKCLVVQDNGMGMSEAVLDQCLIMAKSYSAAPNLDRDDKPLQLIQFMNPNFSRFGRGLASWVYFGANMEIATKQATDVHVNYITADYNEWIKAHAAGDRENEWKVNKRQDVNIGPNTGKSYTRLTIWNLYKEADAELQTEQYAKHRSQVSSLYHFHLHGWPDFLWKCLPDALKFKHGRIRRGGVKLHMFGEQLGGGATSSAARNSAHITELQQTLAPAEELHLANPRVLKPLVLTFRWVPEGKKVQLPKRSSRPGNNKKARISSSGREVMNLDVDDDDEDYDRYWQDVASVAVEKVTADPDGPSSPAPARGSSQGGKAAGSKRKAGNTMTPAAGQRRSRDEFEDEEDIEAYQAEQAELYRKRLMFTDTVAETDPGFVDVLLILFYYPYMDGEPTKVNSSLGCLPLWSGRIMPKDQAMYKLPELVAAAQFEAQHRQMHGSHHLRLEQLGGLLLISPDSRAGKNKDSVDDPAVAAFLQLGGRTQDAWAARETKGTWHLYRYDTASFQEDKHGRLAVEMMLQHFTRSWKPAEEDGQLVNPAIDVENGGHVADAFQWPRRFGDVPPLKKGDLFQVMEHETQGAGGDINNRQQPNTIRHAKDTHAHKLYRIECFTQVEGMQIMVERKPWKPSWVDDKQVKMADPVNVMKVMPTEATAAEICKRLEDMCPYQLAYCTEKEPTLKPAESSSLSPFQDMMVPQGQLKEVRLVLVDKKARPTMKTQDKRTCFQLNTNQVFVKPYLFGLERGGKWTDRWTQAKVTPDKEGVFVVKPAATAMHAPGKYRLEVYVEHIQGYLPVLKNGVRIPSREAAATPPNLMFEFEVMEEAGLLPQLVVEWSDNPAPPYIRTGAAIPNIKLKLLNNRRVRPFPQGDDKQLASRIKLLFQRYRHAGTSRDDDEDVVEKSLSELRGAKANMSQDRQFISITGAELPREVTELDPDNPSVDVSLKVRLLPDPPATPTGSKSKASSSRSSTQDPGQMTEDGLLFKAASGPAFQLVPAKENGSLNDVARGAYLPRHQVFTVQDQHGHPFYFHPAQTGGGKRGGDSRDPNAPTATITMKGMLGRIQDTQQGDRAQRTVELPMDEDGQIVLGKDDFFAVGPMGSEAHISVELPARVFPTDGKPAATLSHTLKVKITRCMLTFEHEKLLDDEKPAENKTIRAALAKQLAEEAGEVQGQVADAWLLDLLPRCKSLAEHIDCAITAPPTLSRFATEAKDVLAGLQELAPDVYARPDGWVYRGATWKQDVIKYLSEIHAAEDMRVYQAVLLLGHKCDLVDGVRILITTYAKDQIDKTFDALLRVVLDDDSELCKAGTFETASVTQRQKEKGYEVPAIKLRPAVLPMLAQQPTVRLRVLDAFDHGQKSPSLDVLPPYGTFYIRQAPRPVSLLLLPSSPALLPQIRGDQQKGDASGKRLTFTAVIGGSGQVTQLGVVPAAKQLSKVYLEYNGQADEPNVNTLHLDWSAVPAAAGSSSAEPSQLNLMHDRVQLGSDQAVTVLTGQSLELHFVLLDQLGVPWAPTPHVQQLIADKAQVTTNMAGVGKARRTAVEMTVVPGSWCWRLATQDNARFPACSVKLAVTSGTGRADVKLSIPQVGVVPGALSTSDLTLTVPVRVMNGAIAKDGIRLQPIARAASAGGAAQPTVAVVTMESSRQELESAMPAQNTKASPMKRIQDAVYLKCQVQEEAEHEMAINVFDVYSSPLEFEGVKGCKIEVKVLSGQELVRASMDMSVTAKAAVLKFKVAKCPASPVLLLVTVAAGCFPERPQGLYWHDDWQGCKNINKAPSQLAANAKLPDEPPQDAPDGAGAVHRSLAKVQGGMASLPAFKVVMRNSQGKVWGISTAHPLPPLHLILLEETGIETADGMPVHPWPPGYNSIFRWPTKGAAVVHVPEVPLPTKPGKFYLVAVCHDGTGPVAGQREQEPQQIARICIRQPHRLVITPVANEPPQPPTPAGEPVSSRRITFHTVSVTAPEQLQIVMAGQVRPQPRANMKPAGVEGMLLSLQDQFSRPIDMPADAQWQLELHMHRGVTQPADTPKSWLVQQKVKVDPDAETDGEEGASRVQWHVLPMRLSHIQDIATPLPGTTSPPEFAAGQQYELKLRFKLPCSEAAGQLAVDCATEYAFSAEQDPEAAAQAATQHGFQFPDLVVAQWIVTSAASAVLKSRQQSLKAKIRKQQPEVDKITQMIGRLHAQLNQANEEFNHVSSQVAQHVATMAQFGGDQAVKARIDAAALQFEDYQAQGGADGPLPRVCLPRGEDHGARNRGMYQELHRYISGQQHPGKVLGPPVMLFRCERRDVAAALMGRLGNRAKEVILVEQGPHQQDLRRRFPDIKQTFTLALPECTSKYSREPVDMEHPQRLLRLQEPQPGVNQLIEVGLAQNRDYGFIGYATNLVYLPPGLLDVQIVPDRHHAPDQRFNLRQSLVFRCFGKMMVFEAEAGMNMFAKDLRELPVSRGRLGPATRMVSVDGAAINMDAGVESWNQRYTQEFMFPGVSTAEQMGMAGRCLDARVDRLKAEVMNWQSVLAQAEQLEAQRAAAQDALRAREAEVHESERLLQDQLRTKQAALEEALAELQSLEAELARLG